MKKNQNQTIPQAPEEAAVEQKIDALDIEKADVFIERFKQNGLQTLGIMTVFKGNEMVMQCFTMEKPWVNNQRNVSCIPAGTYKCVPHKVGRYAGKAFHVLNVPDRTAILVHAGNYVDDTQGCILPGLYLHDLDVDGLKDVASSSVCVSALQQIHPQGFIVHIADVQQVTSPTNEHLG